MRRPQVVQIGALIFAATVGAVGAIAVWGGRSGSAPSEPHRAATAEILRTNLTSTVLVGGTLGYEPTNPLINEIPGTYTALPAAGTVIQPGEVLYRVDNQPIVLMSGATPAWRTFALGMSSGPDIAELDNNLIALGDARGLFSTATDLFTSLTAEAVSRWQAANGYPSTGQLMLGQAVFEGTPIVVGPANVAPGQAATPGDAPYQVTTTSRVVTVPITANDPPPTVGETVSIVLPTGATTPGRITAIGPALSQNPGSQGSSSAQGVSDGSTGGSGSSESGQSTPSIVATVTPDDPAATGNSSGGAVQVSLTSQSAAGVLAAPIAALLALAGGGYGVEVITNPGHHELVGVKTGIFSGSQVQVSGPGIKAGMKVVVAP